VVRVLGYRSVGPGSIPGTTRTKQEVGLERGPLSLVSTTEELLDRKVTALVYKTENTAVRIRHAHHVVPSIRKKLEITSPTSGGRSVGIVRSRTQTMEFSLVFIIVRTVGTLTPFQFLILYTVGTTPWMGDQPIGWPLPTLKENKK
jgi:hypothetical protein